MARGGKRRGTPGKAYRNRTDMNTNRAPISAAPGQQYGKGVAQIEAQRAVPMGLPGTAGGAAAFQMPEGLPQPGSLGPLARPTERPDEPLTAGADIGPGPGTEALALPDPNQEDLLAFLPYLPTLELVASQPNASSALRVFVRRLIAVLPPDQPRISPPPPTP